MINGNVPWEHVTARQLQGGIAERYAAIVLPAVLAIDQHLLPIFRDYVERGGRLVLDAPGGWYDTFGRLLSTDDGSEFERLFGVRIADYQWSRPGSYEWRLDGRALDGCTFDLQPTSAKVEAWFDGEQDRRPAVTINQLGTGQAVVLGYSASLACASANPEAESDLRQRLVGPNYEAPFECDALTYRLVAPEADHYFVINDGETRTVRLGDFDQSYSAFEDVLLDRHRIDPDEIELPRHSGVWIRALKTEKGGLA